MCGLSGIVLREPNDRLSKAFILASKQYLHRRGPDDFASAHITPEVTFTHARLSIIDLALGHQPMQDESGTIIFNGEIYNYQELRDSGSTYRTSSDTEVLLKGLHREGPRFLERADGMFAFAYYNQAKQEITLGRDLFGIKPLYYFFDGTRFAFASRLQPLMLLSKGAIDRQAMFEYYANRAVQAPRTIFADIHELKAGESITFDLRAFTLATPVRWALPFAQQRVICNEQEATQTIEHALKLSVNRHLVSDVPVATFLSGGVDSSLLTALAAAENPDISAFSIGFSDPRFDESRYAAAVCQRYRLRHHVIYCDHAIFMHYLDSWPSIMDDVVADPSAVMLAAIAGYARELGYKVLLSGEGADELFGGYNQYRRFVLAKHLARYGRYLPMLPEMVGHLKPGNSRYIQFARQISVDPTFYGAGRIFEPYLLPEMFGEHSVFPMQQAHTLSEALALDVARRLPDDILTRTDRATMHASIEARVPFLTRYVWEAAASLDESFLINGNKQKYALKKLAERYVPHECLYRRKVGFDLPLSHWLRGPLRERLMALSETSWQEEFLRPGAMAGVIDQHMRGKNDNADKLWAFLLLENNVRQLRKVTLETIESEALPYRENIVTTPSNAIRIAESVLDSSPNHVRIPQMTALNAPSALVGFDTTQPSTANAAHTGVTHTAPSEKLSVLIVSPAPQVHGGVSVFAELLKRHLRLATPSAFWVGSIPTEQEKKLALLSRIVTAPLEIAARVKKHRYDVVHLNPTFNIKSGFRDGLIMLALRLIGYRHTLVYFHGWDKRFETKLERSGALRRYFLWLMQGAAHIMVLSPEFKDALVRYGIDARKITFTRTMFDGALLKSAEANVREMPPSVLYMSRFDREKGIFPLLEAFARLQHDFPTARLIMAGDGPDRELLRQRAAALGIGERVSFPGYIGGLAKARLLLEATIFALPTKLGEGMPIALLEAMGAGKPVLTAPAGAIQYIVREPENGILLPEVTVESIEQGIRQLLSDPERCRAIGAHNREYAWKHFEAAEVSRELEACYQAIARS